MPAFSAEFGMPLRAIYVTAAPRNFNILTRCAGSVPPQHRPGIGCPRSRPGRRLAMLSGMPVSVFFESDDRTDFTNQWRVNFHVDSAAGPSRRRGSWATIHQEPTPLVDGSVMAVVADRCRRPYWFAGTARGAGVLCRW